MSLRYFEGQDHAKVYSQYRPVPPPELIERVVNFLREKYDGPLSLAVDLGCGNGQCTFALGNDFSSVLGTDISPAQISEATEWCGKLKCENVKFQYVDRGTEETLDYWAKQVWSALNEYTDVTIPFSDFTRERGFPFIRTARLADIEGCVRTYSPFQTFCREKGEAAGNDLLDGIKKGITSILNEGRETPMSPEELEQYEFAETFNYFVLMARI